MSDPESQPVEESNRQTDLYDFDRLERAVSALASSQEQLRLENLDLRHKLSERERELRGLDAQLLDSNQRRQDAIKRIDDLIAQLDQLDAQLAAQED